MHYSQHTGLMLWIAEERRNDLIRKAKHFRWLKQQRALQRISEDRTRKPHGSRLRQMVGGFLIAIGQRLQGLPQPNFAVSQYSVGQ